jgi:hypothetical protein
VKAFHTAVGVLAILTLIAAIAAFITAVWTVGENAARVGVTGLILAFCAALLGVLWAALWEVRE